MPDFRVIDDTTVTSLTTVLILLVCLLFLALLLAFLYKKLNEETNGEYTVHNLIYREGGFRDRLRDAARTHLGIRLWPDRNVEVEMEQRSNPETGSGSRRSGCEGEETMEQRGATGENEWDEGGHDSSADECSRSRLQSDNSGDVAKLIDVEEEGDERRGAGACMMVDLKQFSGSVTWLEEVKVEEVDLTVL